MLSSDCAFVFPGQGSQSLGMLTDCGDEPVVREHFVTASRVLGYDLWALIQQGPEHLLNQTEKTQPALLTASVALYRYWEQRHCEQQQFGKNPSLRPRYLAGHSLGEYSALVASGVLTFEQTVHLVALRGRLMQQAVPDGQGAMAAIIGLDTEQVNAICVAMSAAERFVSIANYNAPGQVVIAGHADAVHAAAEKCKEQKAKMVVPLPVSVPSHTRLMQSMTDAFADALHQIDFAAPVIPVVQNATNTIEHDPAVIKKNLLAQLVNPVDWTQIIHLLMRQGITDMVECGPGKVLTGLNKRISKHVNQKNANHPAISCVSFFNLKTCP